MLNITESGLLHIPHLHREKIMKTAAVSLTVGLPIGILAGKELYSRRKEVLEKQSSQQAVREEALSLAKDSVNSGDSKFDFK